MKSGFCITKRCVGTEKKWLTGRVCPGKFLGVLVPYVTKCTCPCHEAGSNSGKNGKNG